MSTNSTTVTTVICRSLLEVKQKRCDNGQELKSKVRMKQCCSTQHCPLVHLARATT